MDAKELLKNEKFDVCVLYFYPGCESVSDFITESDNLHSDLPVMIIAGDNTVEVDSMLVKNNLQGVKGFINMEDLNADLLAAGLGLCLE